MGSRRDFLKLCGLTAGSALTTLTGVESAHASQEELDPDRIGVLADATLCIGCRRCEWACARQNDLSYGDLSSCDDQSVFEQSRRPDSDRFTIINRYPGKDEPEKNLHVKVQCMHCEHPACASACIVGALEKDPRGPVTYDAWKCIGCRYCMVACPFTIPAYEYHDPVKPRVMKCNLCAERTLKDNQPPACVSLCPREALTFGKREDLLAMGRERLRRNPDRYHPRVYGDRDGGGTSWLLLADRDFNELDLPDLPDHSPAAISEGIQHGIFRGFSGPLMLLGLVSVLGKSLGDRRHGRSLGKGKDGGDPRRPRKRPLWRRHPSERGQ